MSSIYTILLMTFVVLFATPSLALKNTAECDLKATIKKCIQTGFLLEALESRQPRLPTTIAEMNELCGRVGSGEECAKKFIERCHQTSKEKRALSHSLEGGIRMIKRVCKTKTKRNEFLANVSKCGNAVLADGTQCLANYKKVLASAEKLQDKDTMLKMMCCRVHEIGPCVKERMLQKGSAVCSPKNIEYMKRLEESGRQELTEVICADYEKGSAKCAGSESLPITVEDVSAKSLVLSLKHIVDKVLD